MAVMETYGQFTFVVLRLSNPGSRPSSASRRVRTQSRQAANHQEPTTTLNRPQQVGVRSHHWPTKRHPPARRFAERRLGRVVRFSGAPTWRRQRIHNRRPILERQSPNPLRIPCFDRGDLGAPHDGSCRQSGRMQVGDEDVARPAAISCTGHHQYPEQPKCSRSIRNRDHQGRATLLHRPVRVRKRDLHQVPNLTARHTPPCQPDCPTPGTWRKDRRLPCRAGRG